MIERSNYNVLVCEAQTVGSIAVIRSLGLSGYKVLACSSKTDALGFKSRYVYQALVCPDYLENDKFIAWLGETIQNYSVACIIPSEGFLLAIRPRFEKIKHLMPLSQKESDVYRGMSKFDLFDSFSTDGIDTILYENLPKLKIIHNHEVVDVSVLELPYPVYVKTDGAYSICGASGNVLVAHSEAELERCCERVRKEFSRFLLQGHVDGVGVGVFVLRWQGKVYAKFMHRRIHEVPHTGGVSSLRESWWNQDIYNDAIARLEFMDWQGVGMLEYRWDQTTEKFSLLEFNGRFWGSLHLALYSGIDFPKLLCDCFNGYPQEVNQPPSGIKCRLTFPKEVQYVWSCLKDPGLSAFRKFKVMLEFFLLGIDPRVRSDMLYGRDWGLYVPMMFRSIRDFLK